MNTEKPAPTGASLSEESIESRHEKDNVQRNQDQAGTESEPRTINKSIIKMSSIGKRGVTNE
jgi:hypothetical protein